VQIAKLLGAGRIIGTGRNPQSLNRIKELGADKVIDLKQKEEGLIASFKEEVDTGIDVVLDFLWGEPTEKLIQTIVPEEINLDCERIHVSQIEEKAEYNLNLSASPVRTPVAEISGGAAGLNPTFIQKGPGIIWQWLQE